MFRLSKMTDYGTVIMSQIATRPRDVFSATELATAVGLPVTTASKILQTLARRELLRSVRGAKGGYVLARPPEQISVADVIAAMEGPVALTECGSHLSACTHEPNCPSRHNWRQLSHMVRTILSEVTLADMNQPLPASDQPVRFAPRTSSNAQ